jgi:hypothetical protein
MWFIIMEGKILKDGYIMLSGRERFLPLINAFPEMLIFLLNFE